MLSLLAPADVVFSVQGQPWIRAIRGSTGGPPLARFPAMHKGHILGSIKLVTVLGIKVLLFVILAATNMFGTRTAVCNFAYTYHIQ